jgi:hypothetical protein
MLCQACGRSLKRSQWTSDGKMKSCPRCSELHGTLHVFHSLAEFGTSEARESKLAPTGIQSHCTIHRNLKPQLGVPAGTPCTGLQLRPQRRR